MSKAVYAKLWMSTSQFHLRRHYGWMHVWKKLSPWLAVYGALGMWLYFPAASNDTKKLVTFGLWTAPTVGYYKFLAEPEE